MDLDWKDLAARVVGLGAPILGQALGGPFGAAAGKILADALGAEPTPAAVGEALGRGEAPAATAAVQGAETGFAQALAAEAEAGRAQVAAVAETMRAEALSGDRLQRWWRPVYAFELTAECAGFAMLFGLALVGDQKFDIDALASLSGLIMTYLAARFSVLGVYVSARSREKLTAATGALAPSLVGEVVRAVVRRR